MKYYHALDTSHDIVARFYTRKGGVAKGLFDSLSFNRKSNSEVLTANKDLLKRDLGVERLCFVEQEHTNDVVVVTKGYTAPVIADAMVSNERGVGLVVLTADCCPVLFYDRVAGVIGAAHAGWRGALSGVIANTVSAMCELGASKKDICMSIGPTIRQHNYEVGQEFYDEFIAANQEFARFFIAHGSKYLFDLPAFCVRMGECAGLSKISDIGLDTYSNENEFFSCRRAFHRKEEAFGNHASAIAIV